MHASPGCGRGRSLPPLLSLVLSGLLAWPIGAQATTARSPVAELQILASSPLLVRARERVRIPVDVAEAPVRDRSGQGRARSGHRVGPARAVLVRRRSDRPDRPGGRPPEAGRDVLRRPPGPIGEASAVAENRSVARGGRLVLRGL